MYHNHRKLSNIPPVWAARRSAGRLFFTPAALKIRQKPPLSNPGERFFKVFGAKS